MATQGESAAGKRPRGRPPKPEAEKSKKRTVTFYLAPETEALLRARTHDYPNNRSGSLRDLVGAYDAIVRTALPVLPTNEWAVVFQALQGLWFEQQLAQERLDHGTTDPSPTGPGHADPDVARMSILGALEEDEGAFYGVRDVAAARARIRALTTIQMLAVIEMATRFWSDEANTIGAVIPPENVG